MQLPAGLDKALPYCCERVELKLKNTLSSQPELSPRLLAAMHHGLLLGGKRIRPFLVYATGDMLGADLGALDAAAGAIEAIHAYSLIHDDLPAMDNDALRRGQPTCHISFGEAEAILAGDALQALAFELLSQPNDKLTTSQQLALIKLLAAASGQAGMCGGQSLDLQAEGEQVLLEQLETIHHAKTGTLLAASVKLAAIAANADKDTFNQLDRFANAIGLAFQVQDDILDLTSDTATLGKPRGSDLESDKSTYPSLLSLSGAKQKAQTLAEQALQALEALPYNTDLLAALTRYIIQRKK